MKVFVFWVHVLWNLDFLLKLNSLHQFSSFFGGGGCKIIYTAVILIAVINKLSLL
jgi:hypothetical protein